MSQDSTPDPIRSEVAQEMSFDQIRYSQVWEDHAQLEAGLAVGPEDDVLSVTSAGCNVLALLLQEPRSVTAIDLSPAQTALLDLKLAGIRSLEHGEFAALIGVREGPREALYARVRDRLPAASRDFWDANGPLLRDGVIHCGRLETYFRAFQERLLKGLWPADLVARLWEAESLEEQAALFRAEALSPAFADAFVDYFGRESMARHGRDPAQFRHVRAEDVGRIFLQRFTRICTTFPVRGNFYMEFIMSSAYRDLEQAPLYLRPANFERLKGLVDRVTARTCELEALLGESPRGTYSKANLSNIFEYMSEELSAKVLATLADTFRPGGRLAYWNLLVPRARPESLAHKLRPLTALIESLARQDRTGLYSAFRVEEVA